MRTHRACELKTPKGRGLEANEGIGKPFCGRIAMLFDDCRREIQCLESGTCYLPALARAWCRAQQARSPALERNLSSNACNLEAREVVKELLKCHGFPHGRS